MYQPLAEILRPSNLADVIGQDHLIGEGSPLNLLAQGEPRSIILWGPPGVGKTTIANILLKCWQCEAIKLSAIFSGIKEIRDSLDIAIKNQAGLFNKPTVIFVDEIHRFNKAQQDAFLHHIEDGSVVLIGATTENPSFELNKALLSRCQVYVLKSIDRDDLMVLLHKAITLAIPNTVLSDEVKNQIIDFADGDARRLLNIVEVLTTIKDGEITLTRFKALVPQTLKRFDKNGDDFYNQISALHKSIRGSDPDAALYWFRRMLDGGADPLYLGRRILRIAWEDIGLADTNAQTIALNALSTYERLGSPEGELALVTAIIYLAIAPKSNSSEEAYNGVIEYVNKNNSAEVPMHLRNAPTELLQDLGYGHDYRYAHDYNDHYVPNENYWPDIVKKQQFYVPTNQGSEKRIVERLHFLRKLDKDDKNN